ncbi:MAG TPA: hypothetical protein VN177_06845 [Myxococcales bacterium]|nr:hypothetical protein [Myxococcales bacterium]
MIRPAGLVLLLLAVPRLARADGPVTDRHYTIDAYRGAAVADYRVVGMGGASFATAEGAIGLLGNPAAAASRPATASSWFYWDFLFDVYTPALAVDYDNSGTRQDQAIGKTGALNAGLVGMFGAWGTAITVAGEVRNFTLPGGTEATLSAAIWRLTLARSFADGEWIAGASLIGGGFNLRLPANGVELVNATDWSVEAGALWRPPERNLRIGASFRPTMKPRIEGAACDPNNCFGYILPDHVEFPWNGGAGVAFRWGPTPWNRRIAEDFRDEKSVILAGDVQVSGPVAGGSGLEAFLEKRLQRSGKNASVSPRIGAEYEWIPGWLRVRGGTYWEPARFVDVSGRLHVTLGLDVRFWSFALWGSRYRLRVSLAADAARQYGNTVLSLGFWH